jgi:transposase
MHVQGRNRDQATLLPERLDDLIGEDNAVRVIDAFVDSLDLRTLGFARIEVKAEISLAVTVYNLTRAINILGTRKLCQALAT